jgi:uncharacterized membrane protein (UPF0182 family)
MYVALLGCLLATSLWLTRRGRPWLGVALAGATLCFFALLSFWPEYLWFAALGYASRFWTVVIAKVSIGVAGAMVGAIVLFSLTRPAKPSRRAHTWFSGVGAGIGVVWGATVWELVLGYANRVSMGITEPVFGRDSGFYLFVLPMYVSLQ